MSDRYGGEFRVWLQPIAEGQPSGVARVLTNHGGSHPAWSPDGSTVTVHFGHNPGLVDFGVSPDGRWLAFARELPTGDIWLAEINGSAR